MKEFKEVGRPLKRVDAFDKVTGRAKYCYDLLPTDHLVAKMVLATVGNGRVVSIDTSEAEEIPGVVGVYTCFDPDLPQQPFGTAGHPWSCDPGHQDIQDRNILTQRVRQYGDVVAAVVAEDTVAADRAVRAVKVEYEEYPLELTRFEAVDRPEDFPPLHEARPNNIIAHVDNRTEVQGGYETVEQILDDPQWHRTHIEVKTPRQSQAHIELCLSFAYGEGDRIVVVSSTQLPHICRRIVAQALGRAWGDIRVIKPYIGGGFGNKQDILYEPLNAWLCEKVGGRCVLLELTREEVFAYTRSRQPKECHIDAAWDDDMNLKARSLEGWSNQGSYAAHGHALMANTANSFRQEYSAKELAHHGVATTFYSNETCAGAMRAYGVPEGNWAAEVLMSDIAYDMGWDGAEFRLNNFMELGYKDPFWPGPLCCYSRGIDECVAKGKELIGWDEKRAAYKDQTGPVRRGVGMALFSYKTSVAGLSLETSNVRMHLAQDGSIMLQMGATEIGQGADTVFSQMAAETVGVPTETVHIVSQQDTDVTPYDSGAYASRQTYVAGTACRKVAEELREKILDYAAFLNPKRQGPFDMRDGVIYDVAGNEVTTIGEVSIQSYYHPTNAKQIEAQDGINVQENTFAMGACFVDLTVDIPMAKVTVNDVVEVHDSGVIINPKTAEQQVHGGIAQSVGMALSEELLTNPKDGSIRNNNLLDYKIPTMMDLPDLTADFVETYDPTGPYGNKALGECPCIPAAPAVRDAILNATGVKFYEAPMTPQRLFEGFKKEGLI